MVVRSSNLALRFYKKDGWTEELVSSFLVEGEVLEQESMIGYDYYIVSRDSTVDFAKLKSLTSKVWRNVDCKPEKSDDDFMKDHLWNIVNG